MTTPVISFYVSLQVNFSTHLVVAIGMKKFGSRGILKGRLKILTFLDIQMQIEQVVRVIDDLLQVIVFWNLISLTSNKQIVAARSTTKAMYRVMNRTTCHLAVEIFTPKIN